MSGPLTGGSGRYPWWLWLLGLAACGGYLALEAFLVSGELGFPLDDTWIHLQFARNLAAGDGLSYNPGEMVTGSTAPLWTALLALVSLLPFGPLPWVKGLGIALYLLAGHATWRLCRELGGGVAASRLAAALFSLTSWMVWAALSGMEIQLFVVLELWGLILAVRERASARRPPLSLAVLAVAALVRPEGLLLWLLACADRLLRFERDPRGALRWWPPRWSQLLAGAVFALLVLAPVLLFYDAVGGSVLPTTFTAKAAALRRWWPEPGYLRTVLGILFVPQPWMVLLAGAGAVRLVRSLGSDRDKGLLAVAWVLALPVAFATISPPGAAAALVGNFGRYYFPLFPVVVVLGALGFEEIWGALGDRVRIGSVPVPARLLLLVLLLLPTLADLVQGGERYARNVANVVDSDVRMARWLRQRLPSEAVLAVNDVGALKYMLPNQVLDLAGIVHPEVRLYMAEAVARGEHWQRGVERFLSERRPDYLVVFPSWFPALQDPDSPYRPLWVLKIPDNITMGGDEIAVYGTPWTRHPLARKPQAAGDPVEVGAP